MLESACNFLSPKALGQMSLRRDSLPLATFVSRKWVSQILPPASPLGQEWPLILLPPRMIGTSPGGKIEITPFCPYTWVDVSSSQNGRREWLHPKQIPNLVRHAKSQHRTMFVYLIELLKFQHSDSCVLMWFSPFYKSVSTSDWVPVQSCPQVWVKWVEKPRICSVMCL